jgi:ketosteroid isomerase-like protein
VVACSRPSRAWLALSLFVATACVGTGARPPRDDDPRRIVEDLLAADRQFSADAARTDVIGAISEMLADDVTMPTGGQFARGKAAAIDVLRNAFGPAATHGDWTPIRGGISADGQQGFTFGYMTVVNADSSTTPLKYLSYWVKQPAGWRVVAYRVRRRPAGDVSLAMAEPALPIRLRAPTSDPATMARHSESLITAERAFSERAQRIGLGPAFVENGSADAVNMGAPDSRSFIVGSEAIGRMIGAGSPQPTSPVSWSADRAIVASSGDLGVTFGVIRPKAPPADPGRPNTFAFFTIWRRPHATGPWRYIAE